MATFGQYGAGPAETLGHSQIHEHVFVRHTPWQTRTRPFSWTTLTAPWRS